MESPTCLFCQDRFKSMDFLLMHIWRQHCIGMRCFCTKKMGNITDLFMHIKISGGLEQHYYDYLMGAVNHDH